MRTYLLAALLLLFPFCAYATEADIYCQTNSGIPQFQPLHLRLRSKLMIPGQ
jgi:hypothetical protein